MRRTRHVRKIFGIASGRLDYYPRRSRMSFQVDLFQSHGQLPANLEQVDERAKDVRYASRTRVNTDLFQQKHGAEAGVHFI